jgi:hypothetical protein
LRLPSQSLLHVAIDRDGVAVTQTLRGKGTAYLAMTAGLFCTVVPPIVAASQARDPQAVLQHLFTGRFDTEGVVDMCWGLAVSVAEAVVLVLVANNTWRKTVLLARDGELSVRFSSLFHRREHHWPFDRILEAGVDRTLEPGYRDPRVELVLRAHGGEHVHLFADHPEAKIESIASALGNVIARSGT